MLTPVLLHSLHNTIPSTTAFDRNHTPWASIGSLARAHFTHVHGMAAYVRVKAWYDVQRGERYDMRTKSDIRETVWIALLKLDYGNNLPPCLQRCSTCRTPGKWILRLHHDHDDHLHRHVNGTMVRTTVPMLLWQPHAMTATYTHWWQGTCCCWDLVGGAFLPPCGNGDFVSGLSGKRRLWRWRRSARAVPDVPLSWRVRS